MKRFLSLFFVGISRVSVGTIEFDHNLVKQAIEILFARHSSYIQTDSVNIRDYLVAVYFELS